MTIEEIQKLKSNICSQITDLLNGFEEVTKLVVRNVDISRAYVLSQNKSSYISSIDLEIIV